MNLFWKYDFERSFPFVVINYEFSATKAQLHMHDYLEIALCTEGQGNFIFPDKVVPIKKGDVFFISRYYKHVAVSSSEKTIKLILILFLPVLFDSAWMKHEDKEYLEQFWNDMGERIIKVDDQVDCLPAFQEMIISIEKAWHDRRHAYQIFIDGQLKVLLSVALEYYLTLDSKIPAANFAYRAKFQPVLDYIEEHSSEKLIIEELRSIVHLSESQFRHNFKLATNMNFKEYLGYVRFTKAIQLLILTDNSVSDIAQQVGFSNINQFYSLFRQYTNISPAKYRQQNRGLSHPDL